MDGIPVDHALVPNINLFIPKLPLKLIQLEKIKTLAGFAKAARFYIFEGLIVKHPNGTIFKLRADMVKNNQWTSESRKHKPNNPRRTTNISPKVLTKDGVMDYLESSPVPNDGEWKL